MKIHLQTLELFIGDNGKVKYRHKRQMQHIGNRDRQFGSPTEKALCGKNARAWTVQIPKWYEYKKTDPGSLCQHCVAALEKQKRNVNAA